MNSKKYLLLIFLTVICGSNCMVPIKDFFRYNFNINSADMRDVVVGNLDDGSSPRIPLSHSFKFFGINYTSLWVNINGGVSFNGPIGDFTPTCAPLSQAKSMIAPFWADIDLRGRGRGTIFWGQTNASDVLNLALRDVKKILPQISKLRKLNNLAFKLKNTKLIDELEWIDNQFKLILTEVEKIERDIKSTQDSNMSLTRFLNQLRKIQNDITAYF